MTRAAQRHERWHSEKGARRKEEGIDGAGEGQGKKGRGRERGHGLTS